MLAETLVMNQLEPLGEPVVKALAKRLKIKAAFWRRFDESADWRLMIISDDVLKGRRQLYALLATVLHDLRQDPDHPVDFANEDVSFFSPNSSQYEDVLRWLGGSMESLNKSQQVGDAFVYKL